MSEAMLTVRQWGKTWQVDLNPQGTVIGRSPDCELVIDSKDVSRKHARVCYDPSGKWVIRDLDSSNGVFVNGKSVESSPLELGDVVEIGHASLSLGRVIGHHTEIQASSQIPKIIVEDFGTEVFYDKPRLDECADQPRGVQLLLPHNSCWIKWIGLLWMKVIACCRTHLVCSDTFTRARIASLSPHSVSSYLFLRSSSTREKTSCVRRGRELAGGWFV